MNQTYLWLENHPGGNQLATALSGYRIIEVTGPDTESFLQGQLSCDIKQLAQQGHLKGAHCNIKGHMISLYHLFYRSPEQIWLRIHNEIAQNAFDTLKKYGIFSKVTLSFADNLSGVALNADTVSPLAQALTLNVPQDSGTEQNPAGIIACYDQDLYEIWYEDSELAKAVTEIDLCSTDESSWLAANIDRALPDLRAATQEHFIPQMTNLQAIDGVSFTKGCYTGQEIVTRLQHRGILKKAMYPFATQAQVQAQPGEGLFDQSGTRVGEIVLCATDKRGTRLIAVVQQAAIDAATQLKLESGEALEYLQLPYTLDPRLFESKR